MVRLNLLLLAVLVVCALSLVASRHQARRLFVELEREQARARASRPSTASCSSSSRRGRTPARVEKIAREQLGMQLPGRGARRGRATARRRDDAARRRAERARTRRPRCRAFARRWSSALLLLLFARSARPRALPAVVRQRLPAGAGELRYCREIEMPAHRGRIVDRTGESLAISTPVKSIWAFPAQFEATPGRARAARARARDDAAARSRRSSTTPRTSCSSRSRSRRRSPTGRGAEDQGHPRAERVPPLLPGRRGDGHIVGFTGDRDAARKASSSRRRSGSPASPAAAA